jgi:hypothetical protein
VISRSTRNKLKCQYPVAYRANIPGYRRYKKNQIGDRIMGLREGAGRVAVVLVTGLVRGADLVKYVLTENDFLLVNGVVGPTQSTMAGWVELLWIEWAEDQHW